MTTWPDLLFGRTPAPTVPALDPRPLGKDAFTMNFNVLGLLLPLVLRLFKVPPDLVVPVSQAVIDAEGLKPDPNSALTKGQQKKAAVMKVAADLIVAYNAKQTRMDPQTGQPVAPHNVLDPGAVGNAIGAAIDEGILIANHAGQLFGK